MTRKEQLAKAIEQGEWKLKLISASDPNGAGGVGIKECREIWESQDAESFTSTALDVLFAEQRRLEQVTNLDTLLPEIANTRIKSAFYKFPKRMVFIGDFAGEALTRKEAIEKEIEWLKEEK